QSARGMNSAPTMGEISFECALWQAMSQLWTGEADSALAGAVDELNKFVLSIGKRWGLWTEQNRPGEGAVAAALTISDAAALARVTAVHLGSFRRPFDASREADWILSKTGLDGVDVILTGTKGSPALDTMYESLVVALSAKIGRALEHKTYK